MCKHWEVTCSAGALSQGPRSRAGPRSELLESPSLQEAADSSPDSLQSTSWALYCEDDGPRRAAPWVRPAVPEAERELRDGNACGNVAARSGAGKAPAVDHGASPKSQQRSTAALNVDHFQRHVGATGVAADYWCVSRISQLAEESRLWLVGPLHRRLNGTRFDDGAVASAEDDREVVHRRRENWNGKVDFPKRKGCDGAKKYVGVGGVQALLEDAIEVRAHGGALAGFADALLEMRGRSALA